MPGASECQHDCGAFHNGNPDLLFFFLPGGVGFFLLYYFSNNPSSKEDLWRSSSSLQNHQ